MEQIFQNFAKENTEMHKRIIASRSQFSGNQIGNLLVPTNNFMQQDDQVMRGQTQIAVSPHLRENKGELQIAVPKIGTDKLTEFDDGEEELANMENDIMKEVLSQKDKT